MHHRIITILFLVSGFQSSGLAQARGLIIYQDEWGADAAFPCVQEAADLSFDLCPQNNFTTTLACFDFGYEVILVNIGTNTINPTIVEEFANYLQLGGNLFFAHDVDIGTSHIDQSMSILMDAIGQEGITTMYQGITEPSTPGTLASIHDIECDTNYLVDFITGSTLVGSGLSESYAFSINAGVCLAFWQTGYGGILGIGTEYFSSGNSFDAGGDCALGSGPLIWGFIDPEDPSCYTCKEPDIGCDDGDCLNGMEYWDENVCDCLTITLEDPGCNDLDCANGIEIWNGCACETIETTGGCTNVFAENYDPEADCDDGSCIISNYYFIPNTFSFSESNPLNSQFQIQGNNIELIEWSIFDRWGNVVFQGNELYDTWDGSFNGQRVPQGVYVYIGVLFFFNGEEVEFKGSITLLE